MFHNHLGVMARTGAYQEQALFVSARQAGIEEGRGIISAVLHNFVAIRV